MIWDLIILYSYAGFVGFVAYLIHQANIRVKRKNVQNNEADSER